jgi:hypothetical protein
LRHVRLSNSADELEVLLKRLRDCHGEGLAARRIAALVTSFPPPPTAEAAIRHTTRLGVTHDVLRAWASLRVVSPAELTEVAPSALHRDQQRQLEVMVENCARNWLKFSERVAGASAAELALALDHVSHPVDIVGENPWFPERLWPEVLHNEGQQRAMRWWSSRPDASPEAIAAIMSNFYPGQFSNDMDPALLRTALRDAGHDTVKRALLELDERSLHSALGALVEADCCDLAVLGALPAAIVLEHIGGDDVLEWFNERLETARDWEAFDVLCRSNHEITIDDALTVIRRIN